MENICVNSDKSGIINLVSYKYKSRLWVNRSTKLGRVNEVRQ
jgi:hypothetical protein